MRDPGWLSLMDEEVEAEEEDPLSEPRPGINRHSELDLAPSNQAVEHAQTLSIANRELVARHTGYQANDPRVRSGLTHSQFKADMNQFIKAIGEMRRWEELLKRSRK